MRLGDVDAQGALPRVPVRAHRQQRRARLAVPQLEFRQVASGDFGEAGEKVLDRRRRAVAAREVEIHAGAERLGADQRAQHADQFGALLIDRRGVEVVDLVIDGRAHRMGERTGVFGKLAGAQAAHVGDALDRRRALVGGKFLIAKNRQPFFEAKLEPIAASYSVASPIVEVLVGDHALDAGVILVGRQLRRRQHVFVVEDVEPLVLHRPHIEV